MGVSLLLPGAVDPRAFVGVGLAPLMCGVSLGTVALRVRVRGRSSAAVRCSDGALAVPALRSLWVALWLDVAGGLLLIALFVAASVLVGITTDPPNIAALVVAVVLVALAVPLAGLVVDGLRGRARRGELSLSANEIRYRAVGYDASMDWAAVRGVSVGPGDGQRIVVMGFADQPPRLAGRSWLSRPSKRAVAEAREAMIVIRGAGLAVDPALAFWTVRHYFTHPAHRTELGTEAAVRRVRSGEVPG